MVLVLVLLWLLWLRLCIILLLHRLCCLKYLLLLLLLLDDDDDDDGDGALRSNSSSSRAMQEGLETSRANCSSVSSCHGTSGCDAYALGHPMSFLNYMYTFREK